MASDLLEGVTWYRGSSVRIRRAGLEVHVDPIGLDADAEGEADFILLTHPHYDNFSEDDIARVRTPETVVVAPASMKKLLNDADHFMRPGDLIQLDGLDVLAVPAYNLEKRYHPLESGWLGYVFTLGGVTYYHAGDTDLVDEMHSVRCDVAFLPVDGHYTMDAEAAALAAGACEASVVVPIRWSEGASAEEAARLAAREDVPVRLLERMA
jgi:L-ascorbate metabolism protein UlaG (beta-lactamase superfamily)